MGRITVGTGRQNKLMSTQFLASAPHGTRISHETGRHQSEYPVKTNHEADRLANGYFDGFSLAYRIPVDFTSIRWCVLDDVLCMGRDAEQACEFAKERAHCRAGRGVRSGNDRTRG